MSHGTVRLVTVCCLAWMFLPPSALAEVERIEATVRRAVAEGPATGA